MKSRYSINLKNSPQLAFLNVFTLRDVTFHNDTWKGLSTLRCHKNTGLWTRSLQLKGCENKQTTTKLE